MKNILFVFSTLIILSFLAWLFVGSLLSVIGAFVIVGYIEILNIKDKVLACWCVPLKCHGHIILEYLEGIPYEQSNNKTTRFDLHL